MNTQCLLALIAALAIGSSEASAADCPTMPVEESGGTHWCYSAGKRGNVHLWKPADYKAKTAMTVVYVHGHDVDRDPRGQPHYVDWAWEEHGLSERFAKSGLNALFIAIEGPTSPRGKPKWTSLDALLKSVRKSGDIAPPKRVIAVAHSAGVHTVLNFLADARLVHVIALDALYSKSPKRLAKWFKGSNARRLTLVGAAARHARATVLGKKLGCVSVDAISAPYPSTPRCLAAVNARLGHMEVVTDGMTLPTALARAAPPDVQTTKKPKKKKRNL